MGGYVGVLVLLGGGFVIQFFGDRDRSSQYVKIYRIEGAALSKQVFDGGSLDLTVLPRKAFADGGSLDLTSRWINVVKGKAFIVVRSSDLNRVRFIF
ncbi:unnamed protein product [Camellia sinensis]